MLAAVINMHLVGIITSLSFSMTCNSIFYRPLRYSLSRGFSNIIKSPARASLCFRVMVIKMFVHCDGCDATAWRRQYVCS